jgi:hypothetical protein
MAVFTLRLAVFQATNCKVLHGAIQSGIIGSYVHMCLHTASFIYISEVYVRFRRHTVWDNWIIRHICLHVKSFVYVSDDKVRLSRHTVWDN